MVIEIDGRIFESVARVLRVFEAQRGDRLHRQRVGLEERRPTRQAKPRQSRPVFVPPLDEDGHIRTGTDVPNARQGQRVGGDFGLVVDRGQQSVSAIGILRHDEADRDETREAGRIDRPEDRPTRGAQESVFRGAETSHEHRSVSCAARLDGCLRS